MDEFEFNCVIGDVDDMPVTITFSDDPEYDDPEVLKVVVRIEGLDVDLVGNYMLSDIGKAAALKASKDHIKQLIKDANDDPVDPRPDASYLRTY